MHIGAGNHGFWRFRYCDDLSLSVRFPMSAPVIVDGSAESRLIKDAVSALCFTYICISVRSILSDSCLLMVFAAEIPFRSRYTQYARGLNWQRRYMI